jgi:hypothetical protein
LPMVYIAKAQDVRGEANQYMRDFKEALDRAGVPSSEVPQVPKPRQTGVVLSIPDIAKPSPAALKMQSILKDAGVVAPFALIPQDLASLPTGFTLFIAPNPL